MRHLLLGLLTVTAGLAQSLTTGCEEDLGGWTPQLNRGALATTELVSDAAVGRQAVKIVIERLAAPDDRPLPMNVHLRHEAVQLEPGRRYRFGCRARSEAPARAVQVRLIDLDARQNVPEGGRVIFDDSLETAPGR